MRCVDFVLLSVSKLDVSKLLVSPVRALSLVACAGVAASFLGLSVSQVKACGSNYGCGSRVSSHHASVVYNSARSHVAHGSHHAGVAMHAQRLRSSSLPSSQHMKAVAFANNPYAYAPSHMGKNHHGYGHSAFGHGYAPHYGYSHYERRHYHRHAYAPTAPYVQPYNVPSVMDLPISLGIRPAPTPEPVIYSIQRDGRVSRRAISHVRHVKTVRKGYDHSAETAQVETTSGARIIYIR